MYKKLIYAVTIMLIGAAAFYFNRAGVTGLVINGSGDNRGNGVGAAEVFSGTYICSITSGCTNLTKIILDEDTTVTLVAVINGQETPLGQGSWGVGTDGSIIMKLQNPGLDIENYPSTLIAKRASSIRITGFSTKRPLFDGMKNPIFNRQRDNYIQPATNTSPTSTDGASEIPEDNL